MGKTRLDDEVENENLYSPELYVIHGCSESDGDDIALIKTDRPIIFTESIGTVCLPVAKSFPSNKKLFHTGWGVFEKERQRVSNILQMAETELFTENHCKYFQSYINLGLFPLEQILFPGCKKLCVHSLDNEGCFVSHEC